MVVGSGRHIPVEDLFNAASYKLLGILCLDRSFRDSTVTSETRKERAECAYQANIAFLHEFTIKIGFRQPKAAQPTKREPTNIAVSIDAVGYLGFVCFSFCWISTSRNQSQ